MNSELIYKQVLDSMFNEKLLKKFEIAIILVNPNDQNDVISYIYDKEEHEELYLIKPFRDEEKIYCPDWAYGCEDFVYEPLEQGYNINYIKLDLHYGVWQDILQAYPEEIKHKQGLKRYLKYCEQNNITKELLENTFCKFEGDIFECCKDL